MANAFGSTLGGAMVVHAFGLVGWLVGWMVGWMGGWMVGWLIVVLIVVDCG